MLIVQANQKRHANRHCGPAPQYQIEDLVWLDTRNLFTKQPSRKLENCHMGKYQVKRIISNYAIKFHLPNDLHVYSVFHINHLKPAATDDPHPGHVESPGPPMKVDGETEYEFTAIVDSWLFGRTKKLQYRVQWIGYLELNWEDAPNITNATDLLHEFYSRYPNKPGLLFQVWELTKPIPKEEGSVTHGAWEIYLLDWVSTLLAVSAHSTYSRDSFLFFSSLCNIYLNYLDHLFNDPYLWIDH